MVYPLPLLHPVKLNSMTVLLINLCKGEWRMVLTRALTTGGGDKDGWSTDGLFATMKVLLSKERTKIFYQTKFDRLQKKEKRLSLVEIDARRRGDRERHDAPDAEPVPRHYTDDFPC